MGSDFSKFWYEIKHCYNMNVQISAPSHIRLTRFCLIGEPTLYILTLYIVVSNFVQL